MCWVVLNIATEECSSPNDTAHRVARAHDALASIRAAAIVGAPALARARPGPSEAMPGVAEGAPGEGKDLRRADGEHERGPDVVCEAVLGDLVFPLPVPLLRPGCGQPLEQLPVGDAYRLALDNHVQAALPVIRAGRQGDARIGGEVELLLLVRARAEMQRVVE